MKAEEIDRFEQKQGHKPVALRTSLACSADSVASLALSSWCTSSPCSGQRACVTVAKCHAGRSCAQIIATAAVSAKQRGRRARMAIVVLQVGDAVKLVRWTPCEA
jgi:hypothetical protein